MNKKIASLAIIVALFMFNIPQSAAQIPTELGGDRYIRIAEMGQITDTVSVWGDVGSPGRDIIPEGTTLPELISFSYGFASLENRGSDSKWAETLIEIKVSRYKEDQNKVDVTLFSYEYNEPEPVGMFKFDLKSNDIVTVQVTKEPSFSDYVGVIAPVVSVLATSILLIQNLQ